MRSKVKIFISVTIVLTIIFTLSGCTNKKREDAILAVIDQVYNAPDNILMELSDKMDQEIENSANNGLSYSPDNSEFFTTLRNKYTTYTTDLCYTKLISKRIPYMYHYYLDNSGYSLKVDSVDIKKNKDTINNYDFTIKLYLVPNDGIKEQIEFTGSAQFEDSSNKLSFIQFFDNTLLKKIQELQ
jgi:hypothetical protein